MYTTQVQPCPAEPGAQPGPRRPGAAKDFAGAAWQGTREIPRGQVVIGAYDVALSGNRSQGLAAVLITRDAPFVCPVYAWLEAAGTASRDIRYGCTVSTSQSALCISASSGMVPWPHGL